MNMKQHSDLCIAMVVIGVIIGMALMYLILAFNKQIIDFNAVMGW